MKIAAIAVWVMAALLYLVPDRAQDDSRRLIYVLTCSGKPVPIFSDEQLTAPMANPIAATREGRFRFYVAPSAKGQCTEVVTN